MNALTNTASAAPLAGPLREGIPLYALPEPTNLRTLALCLADVSLSPMFERLERDAAEFRARVDATIASWKD